MPAPYSNDLRSLVVAAIMNGMTVREAEQQFEVSASTASNWTRRQREQGHVKPDRCGGSVSPLDQHRALILQIVADFPDFTLLEFVAYLQTEGVHTSTSSLDRFFAREGFTCKKKTVYASERDRPDVARKRKTFKKNQPSLDASDLVFVDETSTNTAMCRAKGRSKRGERVFGLAPNGHRLTMTLVAGLTTNGIIAPMIVSGAMNGDMFTDYIEKVLGPELKPGNKVLMDNCAIHKVAGVEQAIEAVGATLSFIPQYSPDFNPIELVFGVLKEKLRRQEERTIPGLTEATGNILEDFTPEQCTNFIRHRGYVQT